jgi:hypothetical protein
MDTRIFSILTATLLCGGSSCSVLMASNPLSPQTPVLVIDSTEIQSSITISGTSDGYMIAANPSGDLQTAFSSNRGQNWTLNDISENGFYIMWVAGTTSGFMTTWIGNPPCFPSAYAYWSISTDQGLNWSSAALISNSLPSLAYNPIALCGVGSGFMASWLALDGNIYASYSPNAGGTWNSPVVVTDSSSGSSAAIVSGTTDRFVITSQSAGQNGISAISTNLGADWTQVQIVNDGTVFGNVWVAGNQTGFVATWANHSGHGYSSLLRAGSNVWGAPQIFATNVVTGEANISVSASSAGFVAAWMGSDGNAYGSFSENGETWYPPVQISYDGLVYNIEDRGPIVAVSVVDSTCMFSWVDLNQNVQASFSEINSIQPPSNLTGEQKKNDFGTCYEIFNALQWSLSPSPNVAGYYVYINGVKTATLGANATNYQNHNIQNGVITSYALTAFDSGGNESSSITISL